jgi:hypothetical protein
MTSDEIEGRVRAIEAVLLHLPGVTLDVIQAAKDWIRDPKLKRDPKRAEMQLQIGGHLDVHAEKALDELKYQSEKLK